MKTFNKIEFFRKPPSITKIKTMKCAVQKVILIKMIRLPDEICDEIMAYLFHEIVTITQKKKKELNRFIERSIIRYEEYNPTINMCIWGVSFFPYDKTSIQNMNCTVCGDFLFSRYDAKRSAHSQHKSCKCIL